MKRMHKRGYFVLLFILINSVSTEGMPSEPQYIFSRIVDMDIEFEYAHFFLPYRTQIQFNVTTELWNSADEVITISSSNTNPYFLRMINLTSNEDKIIDRRGLTPIQSETEFNPGITAYNLKCSFYIDDWRRFPLGNYEVYFGRQLKDIGNSFSAYLEITENSTMVTYSDIPDDWGSTYDITNYSKFYPYISLILIIVIALVLYRYNKKKNYI